MCNAPGKSLGETEKELAARDQANELPTNTIFLVYEREVEESGRVELSVSDCAEIEAALAEEELDIHLSKRRTIGGTVGIFTGAEEKDKGNGDHISCCFDGSVVGSLRDHDDPVQYWDWDRFHSIGWWIYLVVGFQYALEAKTD